MMYIYIYIQTRPISSLNPYIIHISTDIYLSISAYVYLFLALLLVGLQQWVSAFVQHGLLNGDLSGQHLVNSNDLADFTQFGSHRLDVCHSVHSYMIYTEPVTWYAKPPKIGGWKKLLSYKFEDLEYPGICVCVFALVWGMVFIFFHFCLEGMFSYYLYTFIYIYISYSSYRSECWALLNHERASVATHLATAFLEKIRILHPESLEDIFEVQTNVPDMCQARGQGFP